MPGKSRHGKGKHAFHGKKKKSRQHFSAMAAQQRVVAQTNKSVVSPKLSAPSVSAPTPMATPTTARYPYIVAELRRIGILAGIMLVILITLALALS